VSSKRTRTGYAWVAICAAAAVAVALVVFIAQNAQQVRVSFLMWHGRFPLAVALLAAATTAGLVAGGIGSARIVQLRRSVSNGERRAPAPDPQPDSQPDSQPGPQPGPQSDPQPDPRPDAVAAVTSLEHAEDTVEFPAIAGRT